MIGQGRPRTDRVSILFAILLLGTVTAGCATFRAKQPQPTPEPKRIAMRPVEVEPPAPTARADGRERATLDAVEQFLARTEQYGDDRPVHTPATRFKPQADSDGLSGTAEPETTTEIPASKVVPAGSAPEKSRVIANSEISLTGRGKAVSAPSIRSVSVRPQKPALTPSSRTARVEGTTNKPLEIRATDKPVTVDGFLETLRKAAKDDGDSEAAWRYRIVARALGRESGMADNRVPDSSKATPLLTALLDTMDAVRSLAQDPLATGERALDEVSHLEELVADQADPIVETIAFCRRVVTYGVYDEMGADEFVAGRPVSTIVYSEIRNLSSEKASDGTHRTVFASRIELLTASGQSIWKHEEPEIVDRCSRRRNDFFVAQRVTLPATLVAGDYVLKLLIEDKLSGKASETTREFSISSRDMLTAQR